MFTRVMAHMASLAERSEVARPVVAGVMVQVGACQNDTSGADHRGSTDAGEPGLYALQYDGCRQVTDPPPLPIPPTSRILIPPAPIAEVENVLPVRTPAMLAAPLGTGEPDKVGQLAPIDRVEPAMFACNRHRKALIRVSEDWKRKASVIQIIHHRGVRKRLPTLTADQPRTPVRNFDPHASDSILIKRSQLKADVLFREGKIRHLRLNLDAYGPEVERRVARDPLARRDRVTRDL